MNNTTREKLIGILDGERKWPDGPETADAIITALPDIVRGMIKPLVWYDTSTGQSSQGRLHSFEIYENSKGTLTFDDGEYVTEFSDMEDAYAKAATRYEDMIMVALGLDNGGQE